MSAIGCITKRKLANAVKQAIADKKISDNSFDLYRDTLTNEIGLIWCNMAYSAPIRARSDGSIYIGYAERYTPGSVFDRGTVDFVILR